MIVKVVKERNLSFIGIQIICMGEEWVIPCHMVSKKFWKGNGEKEINKLDLDSISENRSIGYFLEVDLEYPDELHDLHNDYSLAPEKLEISSEILINME